MRIPFFVFGGSGGGGWVRVVECFDGAGGACSGECVGVVLANTNRGYAEAARGIYTYYSACMVSLFLLLRLGGCSEWFCVSTGLFTGCG